MITMDDIIEKLPDWLIVSIFILLSLIIVFFAAALFFAFIAGREIKIGPVSVGKSEAKAKKISTSDVTDNDRKQDVGDQISWDTLEKGIIALKDQLVSDQYIPTLIVGIGRGGAVVSGLISGCLGHIPILVLERFYFWEKEERKDKMMLTDIDISGYDEKILLVAGELHTGNTSKLFREFLKTKNCKSVRMYAFFKRKYPACNPEYYTIEYDKADIILPWMITNNYKRQSLLNENTKS